MLNATSRIVSFEHGGRSGAEWTNCICHGGRSLRGVERSWVTRIFLDKQTDMPNHLGNTNFPTVNVVCLSSKYCIRVFFASPNYLVRIGSSGALSLPHERVATSSLLTFALSSWETVSAPALRDALNCRPVWCVQCHVLLVSQHFLLGRYRAATFSRVKEWRGSSPDIDEQPSW